MTYLLCELYCCGNQKTIKCHAYADDVLIYMDYFPDSLTTEVQTLQDVLCSAEAWMRRNSLLLSLEKTELFLLHRPCTELPATNLTLNIGGVALELKTSGVLKWLGVTLDVGLEMSPFVDRTSQSYFGLLRMLRQIRVSLNYRSILLLCNALILLLWYWVLPERGLGEALAHPHGIRSLRYSGKMASITVPS